MCIGNAFFATGTDAGRQSVQLCSDALCFCCVLVHINYQFLDTFTNSVPFCPIDSECFEYETQFIDERSTSFSSKSREILL